MGVSLKITNILVKYLGALLHQIHRQMMLFRPNTIDEANIQAQYLEGDKQNPQTTHKQVEPQEQQRNRKNKKWNEKNIVETTQEETNSIQQCK
jgi:murein tripeptide amidase MpaA